MTTRGGAEERRGEKAEQRKHGKLPYVVALAVDTQSKLNGNAAFTQYMRKVTVLDGDMAYKNAR